MAKLSNNLLKSIKLIKSVKKDVTQLEIHKLLYIIYCRNFQNKTTSLFEENFEAWIYGPVIKEIYFYAKKDDKYSLEYLDPELDKIDINDKFFKDNANLKKDIEVLCKRSDVSKWVDWTHNDLCWNRTTFSEVINKFIIKDHHKNTKMEWDKLIDRFKK